MARPDEDYLNPYYDIYDHIRMERTRALLKHGDNSMETAPIDDRRWWAVCMEEVGEVGKAMQDEGPEEVLTELIQTAAMFTSWAEAALEDYMDSKRA